MNLGEKKHRERTVCTDMEQLASDPGRGHLKEQRQVLVWPSHS